MSKPDYVMSEEKINAMRLNILAGIRNDRGAGSGEYTLVSKLSIESKAIEQKSVLGFPMF